MKIKIISVLSVLILLTTNTYAHSVNWSLSDIVYLYGLYYILPILICLFILYLIVKFITKIPNGKYKSLFVKGLVTFVDSSFLALWAYEKTSPPQKVIHTKMVVSKPIKEIILTPVSIPRIQSQTIKHIKDERCINRTSNEPIGIIACSEG